MRVAIVLGIFFCLSVFGDTEEEEYERAIRHTDDQSRLLLINDCKKAFEVWGKYQVDPRKIQELETVGMLAIQGAMDNNPFEIRTTIYTLSKHEMFAQSVRAPQWLTVLKRLTTYARQDSVCLEPFNHDVKNAYERFIKHQMLMQQIDPLFDNTLACQGVEDASNYFYDGGAMGLYELFGEYDSIFHCSRRAIPVALNGKFLRPQDSQAFLKKK